MAFIPGNRDSFDNNDAQILDLKDGLSFLKPVNDGIGLLKKIGMSGFVAKSWKHQWNEVALATRAETVTLATTTATAMDVADAYIYQINDLIRINDEIVRVTALADADTLTIARDYADTSAAVHTAQTAVLLGSADPENSAAPAGRSDTQVRCFNYVQTFSTSVDVSNDELMTSHLEGNVLNGNIKRRMIEWYQRFSQAFFYGVKYTDASNHINVMGGLKNFITTNPTSTSGALTLAAIDAEIKQIVDAGGDPKVIAMGTKQKQKLDALDSLLVRIGKSTHLGGNPDTQTWQSGILTHTLDVIVDPSILDAEVWILDTDYIKIGYLAGNGKSGSLVVVDASTPGTDGVKKVMRGKYTIEVLNEKAHSYLYALS